MKNLYKFVCFILGMLVCFCWDIFMEGGCFYEDIILFKKEEEIDVRN